MQATCKIHFVFTILIDAELSAIACSIPPRNRGRSNDYLRYQDELQREEKNWEGASPSSLECRLTVGSEIGRSSHHLGLGLVSNLKNSTISCLQFNWKKLGSFFQKS